jgi:AcrR family transcriptional regulator
MARPRQVSDEDILDTARACFLEHGTAVSTAHIAGEVGLSQAALFKRFQTKENLIMQALRPPEEPEWVGRIGSGPDGRPVPDQLNEIGRGMLGFLREIMPRILLLKASGIDPEVLFRAFETPPPVRAHGALTRWFEAGCRDGRLSCRDSAHTALQFMGALHVRAYFCHMFGLEADEAGDAAYIAGFVETFWSGLAPAEDG